MNLIEQADAYSAFYKWFESMKNVEILIFGYVIMPNHFHGLIHIPEDFKQNINKVIANGKRFLAYQIIKSLKSKNKEHILSTLKLAIDDNQARKGQIHRVFIESFDCKEIISLSMLETKLDYIHNNPVSGEWELVSDNSNYQHSSGSYYSRNLENSYLTHYKSLWFF